MIARQNARNRQFLMLTRTLLFVGSSVYRPPSEAEVEDSEGDTDEVKDHLIKVEKITFLFNHILGSTCGSGGFGDVEGCGCIFTVAFDRLS